MATNPIPKLEAAPPFLAPEQEVVFPNDFPLCVDMDGTLLRTDSLLEMWLSAARRSPVRCCSAFLDLFRGRNRFKCALAEIAIPRVNQLPYRREIFRLIEREASAGRTVVLATGAPQAVANAVAEYVGCFREIISTDARVNLTGVRKANELESRFGKGRFYYAGNAAADIPAWRSSAGAVVVGSPGLGRELTASGIPLLAQFSKQPISLRLLARSLRVHQWSKNLLVFLAILLGHRFHDPAAWISATVLLIAMCLCASATYLLNDLADLDADRSHAEKRNRPFASGALGLIYGFAGIPLLFFGAGVLSLFLPLPARLWLCAYLLLTVAYSFFLKEKLLVDVFVLAALYTLRVLAGGSATGIVISTWTLAFSMFLFLSLSLVKRYSELITAAPTSMALPRRNYYRSDLTMLGSLGTASGYIAVLVLALYIHSPEVSSLYRHPGLLWGVCALLAYWISRIWIFANRSAIPGDPILFALKDRISYLVAALSAAVFLLAAWLP